MNPPEPTSWEEEFDGNPDFLDNNGEYDLEKIKSFIRSLLKETRTQAVEKEYEAAIKHAFNAGALEGKRMAVEEERARLAKEVEKLYVDIPTKMEHLRTEISRKHRITARKKAEKQNETVDKMLALLTKEQ